MLFLMTNPADASLDRFTGLCVRSPRAETLTLVLNFSRLLLAKWADVPITIVVVLTVLAKCVVMVMELAITVLARLSSYPATRLTVLRLLCIMCMVRLRSKHLLV